MNSITILAFIIFTILFIRVYLSYKMDRVRGTNSLMYKFIFGAYAFDAISPVLQKPNTNTEARLRRLSNILFAIFLVLFSVLMIFIWIKYK